MGHQDATITLKSRCAWASNESTAPITRYIDIKKCPLKVNWNVDSYTFNNQKQGPTASVTVPTGYPAMTGTISVTYTSKDGKTGGISAGNHTATATTDDPNYSITSFTTDYTIDQATRSISGYTIKYNNVAISDEHLFVSVGGQKPTYTVSLSKKDDVGGATDSWSWGQMGNTAIAEITNASSSSATASINQKAGGSTSCTVGLTDTSGNYKPCDNITISVVVDDFIYNIENDSYCGIVNYVANSPLKENGTLTFPVSSKILGTTRTVRYIGDGQVDSGTCYVFTSTKYASSIQFASNNNVQLIGARAFYNVPGLTSIG